MNRPIKTFFPLINMTFTIVMAFTADWCTNPYPFQLLIIMSLHSLMKTTAQAVNTSRKAWIQ